MNEVWRLGGGGGTSTPIVYTMILSTLYTVSTEGDSFPDEGGRETYLYIYTWEVIMHGHKFFSLYSLAYRTIRNKICVSRLCVWLMRVGIYTGMGVGGGGMHLQSLLSTASYPGLPMFSMCMRKSGNPGTRLCHYTYLCKWSPLVLVNSAYTTDDHLVTLASNSCYC